MAVLPDGTLVIVINGEVRARLGTFTQKGGSMNQTYHMTLDGEYDTSVQMEAKDFQAVELAKLRNTYAGRHAWTFYNGQWYSGPAVAIGLGRWTPELDNNVPMCVRMAEIVQ